MEKDQQQTGGNEVLHAHYVYNDLRQLVRTELNENLQGIDYIYTINGWLKSINDSRLGTNDPGKDGQPGGTKFANDVFGMTLDYFTDDYNQQGIGALPRRYKYMDQFRNNAAAIRNVKNIILSR